jgi:trk system potassium uptake protein TrkH
MVWSRLSTFDAVVHAMTTIATRGMGNYDASFLNLGAATQYVATVFMLLGGMSFVRFVQLAAGDPLPLLRDSQIRAFLGLYAALCLGLLVARRLQGHAIDELAVREVLFNMSSIITTTGFISTDYTLWGSFALALFFVAMMVCGCSGSTAGGPKVFRYQLLAAAVGAEIRHLHSPNAVYTPPLPGPPRHAGRDELGHGLLHALLPHPWDRVRSPRHPRPRPGHGDFGGRGVALQRRPRLGPIIGPVGNYVPLPDPAIWLLTF